MTPVGPLFYTTSAATKHLFYHKVVETKQTAKRRARVKPGFHSKKPQETQALAFHATNASASQ